MESYNSFFSACEDARGYSPAISQHLPSIRTRPRPAGVSGIFKFLILRVRGRTRVQPREPPAQTVGYLIITVKPVTTSLAEKKSGFATVS